MKRIAALLMLLGALTACSAPAAEPLPEEPSHQEAVAVQPDELQDTATFAQAAPEELTYTVTLEPLEETARDEDGTALVSRTYALPTMTVQLEDGSVLEEADTPEEAAALEAAGNFNGQFLEWAAADGFDEITEWAREDRALLAESGLEWHPYVLELACSVYQTEQMVSVRAEYYGNTGGAHPNTVLMAWNFDLTTGQFLQPEQLAADGQDFFQAVQEKLASRCRDTAAEHGMAPEEFFWTNYEEILASWSSYAVSFDETGMTVGFSPYELASYAAGAQEYCLPYEEITAYLSDHSLVMLGLQPAEKN